MVNYKEKYGYEWIEPLISYCSDPFNKFQDPRLDRASLVLSRLLDYNIEEGIIEKDEKIRKEFVDAIVREIRLDHSDKPDRDFENVRKNIESIFNNNIQS